MLNNIKLKQTIEHKRGRRWVNDNTTEQVVNEEFYRNVVDAKRFFRNLGGYERHEKNYTTWGFRVVRVISIFPDRSTRHVWNFDFDNATNDF